MYKLEKSQTFEVNREVDIMDNVTLIMKEGMTKVLMIRNADSTLVSVERNKGMSFQRYADYYRTKGEDVTVLGLLPTEERQQKIREYVISQM